MGKISAATTDGDIAESRATSHDLAVAYRQMGIKIAGLLVCLMVLLACVLTGVLMVGGYIQLPAIPTAEVQKTAFPILVLGGLAAAGSFYLLVLTYMAKMKVGMMRDQLDTAIQASVRG